MLEPIMNKPSRHRSLTIEMIDIAALRPYPGNARRHSRAQIKQIAKSIETFGFTNPILVTVLRSLPGMAAPRPRDC